jgi:hypothetical protein
MNLDQVLGDGPRQTGGRRVEIVATPGVVQGLQQIAQELLSQYELTYIRPDDVKADERLNLSTSRKGVTLHAPTKIPVK